MKVLFHPFAKGITPSGEELALLFDRQLFHFLTKLSEEFTALLSCHGFHFFASQLLAHFFDAGQLRIASKIPIRSQSSQDRSHHDNNENVSRSVFKHGKLLAI